jgi:molybdenum-dependent DNA-binding transcriptional regulator ModE
MLKAAFGGNSQTTAIIACRADDRHGDETLESLRFGERCGMITNAMARAASSYTAATAAVDAALNTVKTQLAQLEKRGKQGLSSYKNLVHSYSELLKKKEKLCDLNKNGSNVN